MNDEFHQTLCAATGASACSKLEVIQSLWSGYGEIARYGLTGSEPETVIVKHVRFPDESRHPRGWNSDLSHQRKVRSYQVEVAWYEQWSARCDDTCRVPHCLAVDAHGDDVLIVLEDLDRAGFAERRSSVSNEELQACLAWLANFHATFMGEAPDGLWETGTYWHLETRPDEWEGLDDGPLKNAAQAIDQALKSCAFQTLVHGDAKLANFCFSADGTGVAAVDFQYVGGGCGMKDVAYCIGSCLREAQCERREAELLDRYFSALNEALQRRGGRVQGEAVEREWRPLYPVAWTDFHRFLKGWSPGHWKNHAYSEKLAREVVSHIQGEPQR